MPRVEMIHPVNVGRLPTSVFLRMTRLESKEKKKSLVKIDYTREYRANLTSDCIRKLMCWALGRVEVRDESNGIAYAG